MPTFEQCMLKLQWRQQPDNNAKSPECYACCEDLNSKCSVHFSRYISLHILVYLLFANINHQFVFFNRFCSVLQGSWSLSTSSCSSHLTTFAPTLSPRGSYPSWFCCTILATATSLYALLPLGWWLVISLRSWLTPLHLFLRGFTNEEVVVWFSKEPVESAVVLAQSIANSCSVNRSILNSIRFHIWRACACSVISTNWIHVSTRDVRSFQWCHTVIQTYGSK